MKTLINNRKDILAVFDNLHDATVARERIQFNKEKNTLDIIFERDISDKDKRAVIKNWWFLKKYQCPIVKVCVHLGGLTSFELQANDTSLWVHTFNECILGEKENEYILTFCEVLKITIGFSSNPAGYFTEELLKDKTQDYWLLLGVIEMKKARIFFNG